MKIKIVQNKTIRVWKYPSHNKYHSLLSFVSQTFNLNTSSLSLQYQDDEGDNVNITCDIDIDDAISMAKEESRKSLKIYIISQTGMDDFLNNALADLFTNSPIFKPIQKPKSIHNIYPHSFTDSNSTKSVTMSPQQILHTIPHKKHKNKPMNKSVLKPEDILNSMFEEEIHKNPPQIPKNPKKVSTDVVMCPEDILNSMVMDMDMNIDSIEPPKGNMNDMQQSDPDEILLQNLLNAPPKKLKKESVSKVVRIESDEDLLNSLLNESDKDLWSEPKMDINAQNAQDIINSIVNKHDISPPNMDLLSDKSVNPVIPDILLDVNGDINGGDINVPMSSSAYDLLGDNENKFSEPSAPIEPELRHNLSPTPVPNVPLLSPTPKADSPIAESPQTEIKVPENIKTYYGPPIISSNVPPAPFHARSPANTLHSVQNKVGFESVDIPNGNGADESEAALALLALPDAPQHKVRDSGSESGSGSGNEEVLSPDEETLEEIKKSLNNPMSFHEMNVKMIRSDSQRQKLLSGGSESENEQKMEGINEDISAEINTEDINESENINAAIEDAQATNENENEEINPENVSGTNEIDQLYAELDDIDMDFEINRLSQNKLITQEQSAENAESKQNNLQISVDNDSNENEINNGIQISPMSDTENNTDIAHNISPRNAENISDNESEIKQQKNEENIDNKVDSIDNNEAKIENNISDIQSDEIIIGIDPSNFNTESESESDSGADMDITQTTPDPIPSQPIQPIPVIPVIPPNNEAIDMDIEHSNSDNITHSIDKTEPKNSENNVTNEQKIEPKNESPKNGLKITQNNAVPNEENNNALSPRDRKRETARLLREDKKTQQKKQKFAAKCLRLAQKKALSEFKKEAKEKERLKRLQLKESMKKQQRFEKLRRVRLKELSQFREVSSSEIFTPNKHWYPIKFVLDTRTHISGDEYETYEDLLQIIELTVTKKYKMHPSFVECVFDNNTIHSGLPSLPTTHHCTVYVYYNWKSLLSVKYQSISLGFSDDYIPKVSVYRIQPWINLKSSENHSENENKSEFNPNEIYHKHLQSEIMKCKKKSQNKTKMSPLKLFKFGKSKPSKDNNSDTINKSPSTAVLLPENCEQTPNFRWKFDLTQDYAPFDPLLNDNVLCQAMHGFEIYFVQIRSEAVVSELPRLYDIFVVYLRCIDRTDENGYKNLLCNIGNKSADLKCDDKVYIELMCYCANESAIANEILSYLRYDRCYGFVTVARNSCPGLGKSPKTEQITFHYGSIGDWLKCAIVGETDFDSDLKQLQKYAKWDNKQHISLCAFLNSIGTTFTM